MGETYLNEQQFCERFNIRPRTAQRWRATGDGPKYVKVGPRLIGYRLSDCEAWAAARTHESRAAELAQKAA